MIMRTTQKKMMSKPVTTTEVGRNMRSSAVGSGQPSVEWHHRADENHVPSTPSSCLSALAGLFTFSAASPALRATTTLPSASYQAGIRWPHQSCREMHQSWTLLSQLLYVERQCSGTKRTRTSSGG